MAREQIVEGLVLRRWNTHETDKWVSLLTREQGKLRLRVRGAHKSGSKMGMLSEPLNIVRTRVIRGRHQQLMVQPQMVATFLKVRSDLERLSAALALVELLDRWLPEEHAEPLVYETALAALNTLEAGQHAPSVLGWAIWRLLKLFGYCPELDGCMRCQRSQEEGEWLLDPGEGGLLCARCAGTVQSLPRLNSAQLALLRDWLQRGSPVGQGEQEAALALLKCAVCYAEHYLEDSPRWLAFLAHLNALPETE
ncbi:DNA repair protein RecO [bacterium HR15]|nr:DNA repair protein RecO [bacterium HR15]